MSLIRGKKERRKMKTTAMKNTETPKNILIHAIHLFAVKGFTETSLVDICGGARVCKPSIFYYFQSKEGLYKAAWRRACHDVATSDIWGHHGHPETVLRETLGKLTGHYFSGGELALSLHFMFMECVHPRLIEKERDLKELSMIRSRISDLFKEFCPDLSDADIKLLLCAILGELITTRSGLDRGARTGVNQTSSEIVELLFRITSSVKLGLARERQDRIMDGEALPARAMMQKLI